MFANTGTYVDGEAAIELAQTAEEVGFESIWTVEHVVVPEGYGSQYPYDDSGKLPGGSDDFDIPDPLIWLAYVAAATKTINLATGILILPQRNPVVTAKAVATIDRMSGGRMILGIGSGWLEEEFDALGVPFEDRGARTDDYIGALRALWGQEKPTHDGKYVSFENAYCNPQPPSGSVPIVVGGHSKRAARRAGELGDGFFPGKGSPEELEELFNHTRAVASDNGRNPDDIELTAGAGYDLELMKRLADLGVSRFIVPRGPREHLQRIADNVMSKIT